MRMAAVCAPAICFKRSIAGTAAPRATHVAATPSLCKASNAQLNNGSAEIYLPAMSGLSLAAISAPANYYTPCLNGTSCSFDFMACSVCLDVMPHSATSSVSGDDTSTTVTWNSGVRAPH